MKKKLGFALLLTAAFFLFHPLLGFPQEYLDYQDSSVIQILHEGIRASFQENYQLAEERFDSLIRMAPDDPAGYFFKAALLNAQMIDYESKFREKELYQNVKTAKKLARERIKKDRDNAWVYVILGNSYGVKAVYDSRQGKWFSGLQEGLNAKSAFKEAIKKDPEAYDAYVGLGSYHYWASVVTKSFHWLPFFGDNRKQGLAEMKLALNKSTFSKTAAASGLVWMYIREGKFDQAIELAQKMQNEYPQGKSFLWPMAEAYFDKLEWASALSRYRELLERLQIEHEQEKIDQSYNLIECRFYIANCLFGLAKYTECDSVCREILNFPLDEEIQKRQKEKLKRTKELSEKCRELTGREG